MSKVIIVGGGPAGMMAAIRAAESGSSVLLLEKKSRLGSKLMLTGKGRCNLTNACGLDDFMGRFRNNGAFLRDAFKGFFNEELMALFRRNGVPLKVERQKRVFPVSDRAGSVLKVLEALLRKNRVDVRLGKEVSGLVIKQGRVCGVKINGGEPLAAEAVILATGGLSYQATGSTGEGLKMARSAGHCIKDTRPALVGLQTSPVFSELQGLALRNCVLTFCHGRKKVQTAVGDLLFTHSGVSGPLVISQSGAVVDWLKDGDAVVLEIDLKPGLSARALSRRMAVEFEKEPRKKIKNLLKGFLPQRMIIMFLGLAGVEPEKPANAVTRENRERMAALFKKIRMEIRSSDAFDTAMVTQGGVSVKDVDPRSMRSRVVSGLYFAGEMLDVDGDTGGFNLQAAFSTGYLAGQSCAGQLGGVR